MVRAPGTLGGQQTGEVAQPRSLAALTPPPRLGLFMIMFSVICMDFFQLEAAQAGYLMSFFGVLLMVSECRVPGCAGSSGQDSVSRRRWALCSYPPLLPLRALSAHPPWAPSLAVPRPLPAHHLPGSHLRGRRGLLPVEAGAPLASCPTACPGPWFPKCTSECPVAAGQEGQTQCWA